MVRRAARARRQPCLGDLRLEEAQLPRHLVAALDLVGVCALERRAACVEVVQLEEAQLAQR